MKVVISTYDGGISLSDKACIRLIELGVPNWEYKHGIKEPEGNIITKWEHKHLWGEYSVSSYDKEFRTSPLLIQVIEELGKEAAENNDELEIIEIPDDIEWYIDYGRGETIHEEHRSWG